MRDSRRCRGDVDERYEESLVANRSGEQLCEYLLKCALSRGGKIGCSCDRGAECFETLKQVCQSPWIQYSRESVVVPFLFFLFSRTLVWKNKVPDSLLINGTVRCGDSFVAVTNLGDPDVNYHHKFDKLGFGSGRDLSSVGCNEQRQGENLLECRRR